MNTIKVRCDLRVGVSDHFERSRTRKSYNGKVLIWPSGALLAVVAAERPNRYQFHKDRCIMRWRVI